MERGAQRASEGSGLGRFGSRLVLDIVLGPRAPNCAGAHSGRVSRAGARGAHSKRLEVTNNKKWLLVDPI